VIGDSVNDFCVHDDRVKRNQVGNEQPHLLPFVENVVGWLLAETECFSFQTRRPRRSHTVSQSTRDRACSELRLRTRRSERPHP
jgi:hypothetical protein